MMFDVITECVKCIPVTCPLVYLQILPHEVTLEYKKYVWHQLIQLMLSVLKLIALLKGLMIEMSSGSACVDVK